MRWHLEKVAAATKRRPKELDAHGVCPSGFDAVWDAFLKLSRRRQCGMGPQPISYVDMDAFQRLHGITLAPWQVEAIELADGLWLAQHG